MSLKRSVPAGVVDSGASALATFAVGLYAVRALDPAALGAYALFFAAFATLMNIPARLVLLPMEVHAAKRPVDERLANLGDGLRLGAIVALPTAACVVAAALAVPSEVPRETVFPLTVTAAVATVISPIQDHVRKMLHIGQSSWTATAVSIIQLTGVLFAIGAFSFTAVPVAWRPFGALAVANVVSATAGALLWHRRRSGADVRSPALSRLIKTGGWLLISGLSPGIGGFWAAVLTAQLAGSAALGFAEAGRVLARPVAVLSQGLHSVLGPRLMRAGSVRDSTAGTRLARQYAFLVTGLGVVYLAIASGPWVFNPLAVVVPQAYVVPGLTATFIAVYILDRVAGAGAGLQLLGAGREKALALGEVLGSIGRIAGGGTASIAGPFAIPFGYFIMSVVRRFWLRLRLRRMYAETDRSNRTSP